MIKAILIARLVAAMLGKPDDTIVCWYQPGNGANVCRVDTADDGYSTIGIAVVVYPDGATNFVAEQFEY